jgi:hypothetical protein
VSTGNKILRQNADNLSVSHRSGLPVYSGKIRLGRMSDNHSGVSRGACRCPTAIIKLRRMPDNHSGETPELLLAHGCPAVTPNASHLHPRASGGGRVAFGWSASNQVKFASTAAGVILPGYPGAVFTILSANPLSLAGLPALSHLYKYHQHHV